MIDGIPNRPLYFYQKDIIVYIYIYMWDKLQRPDRDVIGMMVRIGVL